MTYNYHTHNYRCGHATGTVSDYCEEAIKAGITTLGISDHVPFPDDRWHIQDYKGRSLQIRMKYSELDSYSGEVDAARQFYGDRLKVRKAFECEYLPEYESYYKDELLARLGADYLIGSIHYIHTAQGWQDPRSFAVTHNEFKLYVDHLVSCVESGIFSFIAHPDLIFSNYPVWDDATSACAREILSCVEAHNMPIEINGQGMRNRLVERGGVSTYPYPVKQFWEMARDFKVRVIVNSDAHAPAFVGDKLDAGRDFAREIGIEVLEGFEL